MGYYIARGVMEQETHWHAGRASTSKPIPTLQLCLAQLHTTSSNLDQIWGKATGGGRAAHRQGRQNNAAAGPLLSMRKAVPQHIEREKKREHAAVALAR